MALKIVFLAVLVAVSANGWKHALVSSRSHEEPSGPPPQPGCVWTCHSRDDDHSNSTASPSDNPVTPSSSDADNSTTPSDSTNPGDNSTSPSPNSSSSDDDSSPSTSPSSGDPSPSPDSNHSSSGDDSSPETSTTTDSSGSTPGQCLCPCSSEHAVKPGDDRKGHHYKHHGRVYHHVSEHLRHLKHPQNKHHGQHQQQRHF